MERTMMPDNENNDSYIDYTLEKADDSMEMCKSNSRRKEIISKNYFHFYKQMFHMMLSFQPRELNPCSQLWKMNGTPYLRDE